VENKTVYILGAKKEEFMGKQSLSVNISEKFLKRNFNESLNGLPVKERDYMIETAMRRLGISEQWHNAVAKGACYLDGARFWELVDIASTKKSPAHYFVACVCKEAR
jgi:hypothetical protein